MSEVPLKKLLAAGVDVSKMYESQGHSPNQAKALRDWGSKGISLCKLNSEQQLRGPNTKQIREWRENDYKLVSKQRPTVPAREQRPGKRAAIKQLCGSQRGEGFSGRQQLEEGAEDRADKDYVARAEKTSVAHVKKRLQNSEQYKERLKSQKREMKDEERQLKSLLTSANEEIVALKEELDQLHRDLKACKTEDPKNWDRDKLRKVCQDFAHSNIMLEGNDRHYSVGSYQGFRTLVAGAGLSLSQVKFAFDTIYQMVFDVPPPADKCKISRTVVRSAITALGASDDIDEQAADRGRFHQILFDESAHICIVGSAHWVDELDCPELTIVGAVRIDKQDGSIVGEVVSDVTEHIPGELVITVLSDNCNGMDGSYDGAVLNLFRNLDTKQLKAAQPHEALRTCFSILLCNH